MTEHLGYDKYDLADGRAATPQRHAAETSRTGRDQIVVSLSARGLTSGKIADHADDVCRARVSMNTPTSRRATCQGSPPVPTDPGTNDAGALPSVTIS
jgi:hypothetical protein